MLHSRILSSLHGAALFLGIHDIFHNVVGDHLAGGQDRDSRRIAHHELCTDPSRGFFHRKGDLIRIKGLLGRHDHLGGDIFP